HFTVVVTVTDLGTGLFGSTASFEQTNLVTDNQTVLANLGYAAAAHVDSNLINPWGLAASPTDPNWVADNGTGVSTLYDGNGVSQGSPITIPISNSPGATSPAPVTGIVFNNTSDFEVSGTGMPAVFIFDTEDGVIAAWNSGSLALREADIPGAVYKGLALGNNGSGQLFSSTNFPARPNEVVFSQLRPGGPTR